MYLQILQPHSLNSITTSILKILFRIFNCSQKYEVPVEEFSRSQRDEQKSYL